MRTPMSNSKPQSLSILIPATLALFALPAAAQLDLERSGGTLGANVSWHVQATPPVSTVYALIPSLQSGPTPLALIDPADPRLLGVGLDLPTLWTAGLTGPTGAADVTFPLPANPSLQGLGLYAQALSITGTSATFVDQVSNATGVTLGASGSTEPTLGALGVELAGHTSTLLADGRVLFAGGAGSTGGGAVSVPGNRLYLYDPQTEKFSASAATLTVERAAHTATLLADGRVLLVGGTDPLSTPLASAEIFDPVTETVTPAAAMPGPRVAHTATLLADGRVFVAGGANGFNLADPLSSIGNILASSLVYNPSTNSWSSGPNLPDPRVGHAASRLTDGRVLLTGGLIVQNILFIGPVPSITADARYYNPGSNSFSDAPDFGGARALHAQVTLADGRVLVAGGAQLDILSLGVTTLSSTRVFSGGGWANGGNLSEPRVYAVAADLGDGSAVVLGGLTNVDTATGSGASSFNVDRSSSNFSVWTVADTLEQPRVIPTATAIEGGARVLIGSFGVDPLTGLPSTDTRAELFIR
jgi:hypothetical protein